MELVVFPDAAAATINYLRTNLGGTVVGQVPSPRPAQFVTVVRVGGLQRNRVVDDATLAVECWAASDEAAHDLAQLARAYLHAAEGTVVATSTMYRVDEVGGIANLPDPVSEQPRAVFAVAISVRGSVLTAS